MSQCLCEGVQRPKQSHALLVEQGVATPCSVKIATTPERRFAMTNEDCDTVSFAGMTILLVLCSYAKVSLHMQFQRREHATFLQRDVRKDFMTLENNLSRTLELIDLCFRLKEAYIRQLQPQASPEKIRELIYQGIRARKEKQWTSPEIFLKH